MHAAKKGGWFDDLKPLAANARYQSVEVDAARVGCNQLTSQIADRGVLCFDKLIFTLSASSFAFNEGGGQRASGCGTAMVPPWY